MFTQQSNVYKSSKTNTSWGVKYPSNEHFEHVKKKNKTDSFGFTDFEALKGSPPLGSTMVLRFSRLDPSWIGQEALTTLLQALQFQGRSVPFRGCQNLARSGTSSVALCDLTTRKMVI